MVKIIEVFLFKEEIIDNINIYIFNLYFFEVK